MNSLLYLLSELDPTQEAWVRVPIGDAEEMEIETIELWEEDDFVRTTVHLPQPLHMEN